MHIDNLANSGVVQFIASCPSEQLMPTMFISMMFDDAHKHDDDDDFASVSSMLLLCALSIGGAVQVRRLGVRTVATRTKVPHALLQCTAQSHASHSNSSTVHHQQHHSSSSAT
eukprot:9461627-Karenia_brevis.AAC.1